MNRKNIYVAILAVVATVTASCSKDEIITEKADQVAQTSSSFEYQDLILPENTEAPAGTDATGGLNYPTAPHLQFPNGPDEELPYYPFEVVKSPTASYLTETCLFDVSKLENNKTYHKLQNGSLRIGFFSAGFEELRMLKLASSSPSGWNAQWGLPPAVENEKPDVFYAHLWNFQSMIIYLSKPCTEFGFEIAPNNKIGTHRFYVDYGDWLNDDTKGSVSVETHSPSGASLVAVKASKPFRLIRIHSTGSPTLPVADGLAIANIRYRLAGK